MVSESGKAVKRGIDELTIRKSIARCIGGGESNNRLLKMEFFKFMKLLDGCISVLGEACSWQNNVREVACICSHACVQDVSFWLNSLFPLLPTDFSLPFSTQLKYCFLFPQNQYRFISFLHATIAVSMGLYRSPHGRLWVFSMFFSPDEGKLL